jgi:hypothetical protein
LFCFYNTLIKFDHRYLSPATLLIKFISPKHSGNRLLLQTPLNQPIGKWRKYKYWKKRVNAIMWTPSNWDRMASSVMTVTDIQFTKPGVLNIHKLRTGCNHLGALALNSSGRDVKQIFRGIWRQICRITHFGTIGYFENL